MIILMVVSVFSVGLGFFQTGYQINIWGKEYFKNKNVESAAKLIYVNIFWGVVATVASFFKATVFYIGGVFLGRKVHSKMVFRVLHSDLNNFLKRTPIGRILNRFSNDINAADNEVSRNFDLFCLLILFFGVTTTSVFFGASNVLILIPLVLYMVIAIYVRRRLMNAAREIYRLYAITKSPIVGLSGSCVEGGPSIRGFKRVSYFNQKCFWMIEENTKNAILTRALPLWFRAINIQLNLFVVLLPCYALFIIKLRQEFIPGDPKITKDLAKTALFLEKIVSFVSTYEAILRFYSNIENTLISIERCEAYNNIPIEEGYKTYQKDSGNFNPPKSTAKEILQKELDIDPERLLKNGEIKFRGVTARYPTLDKPVLRNINIIIKDKEKVGIVGRTGAGKSSFIKLIWRALVPSEGRVDISGININVTDLKRFRKEINVITQKPNLFEGTILSNITHKKLTVEKISQIKNQLLELGFSASKLENEGLSYEVEASGDNLSQSERQILCLVQSLQTKAKVVIMDEATAYIDEKVEKEFQRVIWDHFSDSTILIIAHRISNVMRCDRVLVFDDGEIVEAGNPQDLVKDKRSKFFDLWKNK